MDTQEFFSFVDMFIVLSESFRSGQFSSILSAAVREARSIAFVLGTLTTVLFLYTAAFTYYYDPVILQNKLTPLSIFRDLALRKRDSKKLMFYFYVVYRVYINIQK